MSDPVGTAFSRTGTSPPRTPYVSPGGRNILRIFSIAEDITTADIARRLYPYSSRAGLRVRTILHNMQGRGWVESTKPPHSKRLWRITEAGEVELARHAVWRERRNASGAMAAVLAAVEAKRTKRLAKKAIADADAGQSQRQSAGKATADAPTPPAAKP